MKKESIENDRTFKLDMDHATCSITVTPIRYSLLLTSINALEILSESSRSGTSEDGLNGIHFDGTSWLWPSGITHCRMSHMYYILQVPSTWMIYLDHIDSSSIMMKILVLRFYSTWYVAVLTQDNWFPLLTYQFWMIPWSLNLRNLLIWMRLKTRGLSKNSPWNEIWAFPWDPPRTY